MIKAIHKSRRNDLLLGIAVLPLYIPGIGRYGWQLGVLLFASIICGYFIEKIVGKIRKLEDINYPVYLWLVFPLVFPPAFPLVPAIIGIIFSLVICLHFFGGHGRQIVSPVAICWGFSILSFPSLFGRSYVFPFSGFSEGFSHWRAGVPTVDNPALLFQGNIGDYFREILNGSFPQTAGNVFPLLVIIIGLALLFLRAVDFRVTVSFLITYLLGLLIVMQLPQIQAGFSDLFIGNFLLTAFFILPDMRTSSRTFRGRWICGILAGICGIIIRYFSGYPDGIMFAVILSNIFSGIIDEFVLKSAHRKAA